MMTVRRIECVGRETSSKSTGTSFSTKQISPVSHAACWRLLACMNFKVKVLYVCYGCKIGPIEVNADKRKYMVMSRDQNAGWSHNMKTDNRSSETVEQFKYLGTALTYQNSIQEEIKRRMKARNACCHAVQNLLSSKLLSNNTKIKIYRTIILPVVLCVKLGHWH